MPKEFCLHPPPGGLRSVAPGDHLFFPVFFLKPNPMNRSDSPFDAPAALHRLKHFLPAQAPLKDFIHHNTLHAFQQFRFHDALHRASQCFGYTTSLSLDEYRAQYAAGRIRAEVLRRVIAERKGAREVPEWEEKLLHRPLAAPTSPRIGALRARWKRGYRVDLDSLVHPILFRVLCSYLDQGISIWRFPVRRGGFLSSLRELERHSFTSLFRTKRVKKLLLETDCHLTDLLARVVGDETLYERYLFDQQFAHQGWSGLVSTVEDQPQTLLDSRPISLHDLIVFELLLEIDALDERLGKHWVPLGEELTDRPADLFAAVPETERYEVLSIWQDAFEWSYYDGLLARIQSKTSSADVPRPSRKSFQALFCIDDRECSIRRYLEAVDPACETFGTPGFFGVEFFFQPENGKFYTKVCPAPITPKYLVKEIGSRQKRKKDAHFSKHAHSFHSGWLISQTLGFWAAARLAWQVFRPTMSPATASSFEHMDQGARLTIEHQHAGHENALQVGFTVEEMAQRVENLLNSIGLVEEFAPIVYVIGHGASSVNNPHYAAYDCGACSGRAGSVNARVISHMANHPAVRQRLAERGLRIPATTQFVGGLHDTTRDELVFFDEVALSVENAQRHQAHEATFRQVLDLNARERSLRFESIDSTRSLAEIHRQVRLRSVSLFEPRPELNHATNAACVVGRRSLTKGLFLDRRSFMNSFDYRVDPEGQYLLGILKAAAPVCGGINLEYFFSRVDNQKLGAGTKLPHNVMGLFGVANGIDGDLRPGLPSQMIEVHEPIRLLMVVEHYPNVVLEMIRKSPETYEWFRNEWVHLVAIHPETRALSVFRDGAFVDYRPLGTAVDPAQVRGSVLETEDENGAVYTHS